MIILKINPIFHGKVVVGVDERGEVLLLPRLEPGPVRELAPLFLVLRTEHKTDDATSAVGNRMQERQNKNV